MIAAVLEKHDSPLAVREVGYNQPDFGQVLVRVLASGICGAQLQEIRGEKGGPLPHLLGHEGCGIVEAVGAGVARVKEGDKVVMHWRKAAGIECDFPTYWLDGRQITSGKVITFAEYAVCSENRLTPVPPETPVELCALLGCGLSTALATIENEVSLRFGQSVLIVGCGGLGANLIRAAKFAHASPVVAVDVHESKRDLAMKCGADHFCTDARCAGGVFDAIIDTAGNPRAMTAAMTRLAPSGRYVMVGQPKPGESIEIESARSLFDGDGKTVRATQGGGFRPDLDIPRYVRLHQSGALKLGGIITHRVGLRDINEAIDAVRNGEAGRVLVQIGKEKQ